MYENETDFRWLLLSTGIGFGFGNRKRDQIWARRVTPKVRPNLNDQNKPQMPYQNKGLAWGRQWECDGRRDRFWLSWAPFPTTSASQVQARRVS